MPPDTGQVSPSTLMSALDRRAIELEDRVAYRFLRDGEVETEHITFGELRRRALAVAARLTALNAPGDRAVLIYPQGIDFIVVFFGCLYAGVLAVPVTVPNRKRGIEIIRCIAADCDAKWLLSTGEILERFRDESAGCAILGRLSCLDTERWQSAGSDGWTPPDIEPGNLALLQYTSGSTGSPRGVAVTHANLAHNHQQVERSLNTDASTIYVSWLPMFHDMGLGTALQAVWVGVECVLMSPRAFVQEPRRWLRAISRYRATSSGGPDFAFELCVRRIESEERVGLDLSSWRVAYNGSEPVQAATLDRFAAAFAASGFRRDAFHPMYGLAEATLLVTSEPSSEPLVTRCFSSDALERGEGQPVSADEDGRTLVSCGRAWLDTALLVVDPETREPCAPGRVGEIWIRGASVAAGYWNREAETKATFAAVTRDGRGPYLRSGDLGFLHEGRLFVTGRRHDLIVIQDQSHYPQDIEASVSRCHPALMAHGCAAFATEGPERERLVIVQEVTRAALKNLDSDEVIRTIRAAVAQEHGLDAKAVVLLKPATLPRTTSGKVRRRTCRAALLDGSLPSLAAWLAPVQPRRTATLPVPLEVGSEASRRADRLIEWLRRNAADLISCHAATEQRTIQGPLLRDLAKQGLLGMQIEPSYGGLGLSHFHTTRVLEQLAAIDFVVALFVGINNYLGIGPIARHASPELKAWLLPGLAHGQELAAFAFAEPGSPTPSNCTATRVKVEGRERFRLSGTKYLDGVADAASVINVFACHKDPVGMSAFVVAGNDGSLNRAKDGLSTAMLGFTRDTIVLEGLTVGPESLLGALGAGTEVAREALMHTRLAMAAACIGGMKRCAQIVSRSIPYAGALNPKRTPNPVILSRLGSMKARITALECMVHRIARAIDRGHTVPPEAFVACKILGPELLLRSVDDLSQLGVASGYAETNRISCLYRDAGLLRTFDGAPEAVAELTGAIVMEGGASLKHLAEEVFGAPGSAPLVDQVIETVRQRMTKLNGALARRAQRWGHTRAGEIATWVALLAALEGSRRDFPSPELKHAHTWAEAQFEQALWSVRYGTPSEAAAVDSSDVAAMFATYARTIGELEF